MARPRKNDTSAHEGHIAAALEKTLEAFFEGHDVTPQLRLEYLNAYLQGNKPPTPIKKRKPKPSRVKISSESDIERMWADHEKSRGPTSLDYRWNR